MKNYAAQIKALRKWKGWTQERLAGEVGVNFVTVNRWENGHGEPSPLAWDQLKRLGILEVPIDLEQIVRQTLRVPRG